MLLVESLLGSSSSVATFPAVEDVFSTTLYNGTGATQLAPTGVKLGAGATSSGWFATLSTPAVNTQGYAVALDGAGSSYVCGTSAGSMLVAKYNSSGVLLWQISPFTARTEEGFAIAVDSSNNPYVCGYVNIAAGNEDLVLIKFDADGGLLWQRTLDSGAEETVGLALTIDSSDNIYVGGARDIAGFIRGIVAKYDTSGVIQWQRAISHSSLYNVSVTALATDSSGNVYGCGNFFGDGVPNRGYVFKLNSSGTLQWQTGFGRGDAFSTGARSVAVDSAANVYVSGYNEVASGDPNDVLLIKFNTSGVAQWMRSLATGRDEEADGVAVDSSANVYITGYYNRGTGLDDCLVAKYNTSGTLQWQRLISSTNPATFYGEKITTDNLGSLYICGRLGNSGLVLTKLPDDGSGTGFYTISGTAVTFSYQPSSLTGSSLTTNSGSSITVAASTLTDAAGPLTNAASTLTPAVIALVEGAAIGGLVWIKGRSGATDHALYDTVRGATFDLGSNLTTGQTTQATGVTGFLSNAVSIGALAKLNTNGAIYAAWAFGEGARFFDVVTYTGTGLNRTIAHNLGSVPGCIMVKRTDVTGGDWQVYHRSLANTQYMVLNSTAIATTGTDRWNSTTPTASVFSLGNNAAVNAAGGTYVAYLFAHDAGGFGSSATDNIITCGSYTGNGSATGPVVTLGYEPQWILIKRTSAGTANWWMFDNMRGLVSNGTDIALFPNLTNVDTNSTVVTPTATGFQLNTTNAELNASGSTYLYIAIRRGPMRAPTRGTTVFTPIVYTGTNLDNRLVNTGMIADMIMVRQRDDAVLAGMVVGDRLRGQPYLLTGANAIEASAADALDAQLVSAAEYGNAFSSMSGFWCGNNATAKLNLNTTSNNHVVETFRRAAGFFDIVAYTGTGANTTVAHNLSVVPELILVKARSSAQNWAAYSASLAATEVLSLNSSAARATDTTAWNSTRPTNSVFSVGTSALVNSNTVNYVAYLFASCPGVSRVGSYTGTGTTQIVDCGFAAGARFVLVKRIDNTGDWFIWDTARGIVAGNDPYLRTNSTAAETTTTDWVDAAASGFELSSAGGNSANVNGASYIFLAIA